HTRTQRQRGVPGMGLQRHSLLRPRTVQTVTATAAGTPPLLCTSGPARIHRSRQKPRPPTAGNTPAAQGDPVFVPPRESREAAHVFLYWTVLVGMGAIRHPCGVLTGGARREVPTAAVPSQPGGCPAAP